MSSRPPAHLFGIRIDNLSQTEALDRIEAAIAEGTVCRMTVVNSSKLVLSRKDVRLRKFISESDLVTADGMSVVWASRLLKSFGGNLVDRVTGIDTLEGLAERAAQRGFRIFLLGASPGIAERAAEVLTRRHPGICIVGCRDGFFPPERSLEICEEIRRLKADILFVAMGSPKQEFWIEEFFENTGARFCLGVGGSLDHIAGVSKRAPRWMQRVGLEWLYRLGREPRRLWRRYLIGNVVFLWWLFRDLTDRRSRDGTGTRQI